MSWLSLLLFSICISLFCMIMKQKKKETRDDEEEVELNVPNGPLGIPFLGNILQLGNRPFETLFKWRSEYGPIFKINLGSKTVVVLNGTKIIREALVEHGDEFAGRPHLYMIHATLKGKGVISSPYNTDYNEHKKFLLNTFNRFGKRRSSLENNCLQTIRETLDEYREKMDHEFDYTNVFMKNSLSQITSQNVLTMTFGNRMHDKRTFSILMDLISENFKNTAISAAFNFLPITRIFQTYILKNAFKCSEFLNNLISEKVKEFNDSCDFDEDTVNEIKKDEVKRDSSTEDSNIIECYLRELMNNVEFFTKDSIDSIIGQETNSAEFLKQSKNLTERRRSSINELTPNALNSGRFRSRYKSFSFDHLSSMVQDLFVAGTETVSNTLYWALIYVTYFPEVQKEIHSEIDRLLGKEKLPTESDRFKLAYTEAFLNETMRFHCAGPILIPRSTTCNLMFRGYSIPENTFIMVNMWSCMHDPEYWDEPEKFNPKRFINEQGKFECKNPAMMPFSIGKRACTGESLARLQLFLIFTSLLQKFIFSFSSDLNYNDKRIIEGIPGIGLKPQDISLKLKIR